MLADYVEQLVLSPGGGGAGRDADVFDTLVVGCTGTSGVADAKAPLTEDVLVHVELALEVRADHVELVVHERAERIHDANLKE